VLPTPYIAYLRVYEPLELYKIKSQFRCSEISNIQKTIIDEQVISLSRVINGDMATLKVDKFHLIEHEGKSFIAPWSTFARCTTALENLKSLFPNQLISYLIPRELEETINSFNEIVEDKVSHIISSTWIIPPRWFALFTPDDRVRENNGENIFTVLRTSIYYAIQRAIFTHKTVLNAFGAGPIESEISELIKWLGVFDKQSIVELDYGGLATYLHNSLILNGEPGLDADSSIEDVSSSLAGLASGDGALASRGYERLVTRWRRVAAIESAS
jgi:hypothetical protein